MNTLLFRISLIFLIISCDDSRQREHNFQEVESPSQRNDRQFNEAMIDITSKLDLNDLRNGVDSFEARIWCPIPDNSQNLIIISRLKSGYRFVQYHVWESYPNYEVNKYDTVNHLLDVKIDSVKIKILHPNIAKELFIDSLQYFYLPNFPTTKELVNSTALPNDGLRYIFEIAQKKEYQLLDYGWGEVTSKFELHDRVHKLLDFLQRHLDSKVQYWK